MWQAAPHTIGLCLERKGPANHEYTVSNKMFDYMMGGLAVVSADLKGLHSVIKRSGGGVLFEPGILLAAVIFWNYITIENEQSSRRKRARICALGGK